MTRWERALRAVVGAAQRQGWWLKLRKGDVQQLFAKEHEHLLGALAGPAIRRATKAFNHGSGMRLSVGEVQALELPKSLESGRFQREFARGPWMPS